MKPYRYAIFDLDGTLIDSLQALTTALNLAGEEHGFPPLTNEVVRRMVGEGIEKLVQRAFAPDPVPANLIESFERHYDEACCPQSRVLDGVAETLEKLHSAGIAMGVCTNKPTSFSVKILRHLGLTRYFDAIIGPDVAGARKPDPRHVLRTLDQIGGTPEHALFVGDMPIDVAAARAAKVDVAVLATGSSDEEELRRAAPDYLLERFSHLTEILVPVENLI